MFDLYKFYFILFILKIPIIERKILHFLFGKIINLKGIFNEKTSNLCKK